MAIKYKTPKAGAQCKIDPPANSTRNCCEALPMLRPRREPSTSTAAFPFTFASGPRGM